MKTVLSTKVLSPAQKELFLNSGIGLVTYAALEIEYLPVKIPQDFTHLIFTSKNGVIGFLESVGKADIKKYTCFCVGSKTKHYLEENGLVVGKTAENALELANYLSNHHENESFLFFSGNMRRPDLPEVLLNNNVRYKEITTYQSHLKPKKFVRLFDGILFFSPSGIKSYMHANNLGDSVIFCIGNTTAEEAKKHTNNIIVANRPTVENVLVQAIKYFKEHD